MLKSTARTALAALAMIAAGIRPAASHDFWVQPAIYWAAPGVDIPLTLQVGHGPFRQRSLIPLIRILRFEAMGPAGSRIDLHSRLQIGGPSRDGAPYDAPAACIVLLRSEHGHGRGYVGFPARCSHRDLEPLAAISAADQTERLQ
jgi:hypothetical protein